MCACVSQCARDEEGKRLVSNMILESRSLFRTQLPFLFMQLQTLTDFSFPAHGNAASAQDSRKQCGNSIARGKCNCNRSRS